MYRRISGWNVSKTSKTGAGELKGNTFIKRKIHIGQLIDVYSLVKGKKHSN